MWWQICCIAFLLWAVATTASTVYLFCVLLKRDRDDEKRIWGQFDDIKNKGGK